MDTIHMFAAAAVLISAGEAAAEDRTPLVQVPYDPLVNVPVFLPSATLTAPPDWEVVEDATSSQLARDGWATVAATALPLSSGSLLVSFWQAEADGALRTVRCIQHFSGAGIMILDGESGREICAQPVKPAAQ